MTFLTPIALFAGMMAHDIILVSVSVLATFWACFHALLAYLVVRRAFWPDDRRYSTRHTVYLPAQCEWEGDDGPHRHLGMTFDLNDFIENNNTVAGCANKNTFCHANTCKNGGRKLAPQHCN